MDGRRLLRLSSSERGQGHRRQTPTAWSFHTFLPLPNISDIHHHLTRSALVLNINEGRKRVPPSHTLAFHGETEWDEAKARVMMMVAVAVKVEEERCWWIEKKEVTMRCALTGMHKGSHEVMDAVAY